MRVTKAEQIILGCVAVLAVLFVYLAITEEARTVTVKLPHGTEFSISVECSTEE